MKYNFSIKNVKKIETITENIYKTYKDKCKN